MSSERKASEVILDLEFKVIALQKQINSVDLKLCIILEKLSKLLDSNTTITQKSSNNFSVEASDVNVPQANVDPKYVDIKSDNNLGQLEEKPQGFRRTSRSAGPTENNKFPIQVPKGNGAEIIVPKEATQKKSPPVKKEEKVQFKEYKKQSNIPVIQRVLDPNGKSVFLAEVKITNLDNNKVYKARTNAIGKWTASLEPGGYSIKIQSIEQLTNKKYVNEQSIFIDSSISPLKLDDLTLS